jgi:hypothetical protein
MIFAFPPALAAVGIAGTGKGKSLRGYPCKKETKG